jgi:hypothetical protein
MVMMCKRGHALAGDNLAVYRKKNGAIEHRCRTCHREYMRELWRRKQAQRRSVAMAEPYRIPRLAWTPPERLIASAARAAGA